MKVPSADSGVCRGNLLRFEAFGFLGHLLHAPETGGSIWLLVAAVWPC